MSPYDEPTEPVYTGLYNAVVQRVRQAKTIFGDNVKLVLRQLSDEQWALLSLPYVLVVPTVTRVEGGSAVDGDDVAYIDLPRSITFLAQLDGRGSEAEWMAARDIERAERDLIGALLNWVPPHGPEPVTQFVEYGGMRIEATRAPAVKVAFIFTFWEELAVCPDHEVDECGDEIEPEPMQEPLVYFTRTDPCSGCEPWPVEEYAAGAMWRQTQEATDDRSRSRLSQPDRAGRARRRRL